MGPLPVTRLFNPRVVGMEIDYAGNTPMSAKQYRSALAFAVALKRRYGSIERCRAHMETSIEGKWDPGWSPGKTIDMNQFRRDALTLEASGGSPQEDDLSADDVLFNKKIVGPDGKATKDNLNNYIYWTNHFVNMLPGIASKLDALGTVVAEIAKQDDRIELTDEQAEKLGTQIEAMLTVGLDELVDRLDGLSKDDMREVLRETRWGVVPSGSTNPGGGL